MTIRSECGPGRTAACRPAARAALLALGVAALGAGGAGAQGLGDQVGVAVGDATLYPSVRLDYVRDSNVGLRPDDEVAGDSLVLSPRLDYLARRRSLSLSVGYRGEFSTADEAALQFADHRLAASLDAAFDARRRGSLELTLGREHDDLGTDLTRGLGDAFDEPLKSNTFGIGARFVYGARAARGNLIAGLDVRGRNYTNLDAVSEGRDFVEVEPFGAFGYRVSADTRAVVELRYSSAAFDDEDDDRDEVSLLLGADFTATGRLRGGVRLGASRASFAQEGAENETEIVARGNVSWLPREFAVLSLVLDRRFDNTTSTRVGEDQSIRTQARLTWEHQWSGRFSTDAFAELIDVERACPDRPTATASIGAEFDLSVRRWLEVGAGVSQGSRTADACPGDGAGADELDFDRTRYGVHVRATL